MAYLIYAIDFENMDDAREKIRSEHGLHLHSIGKRSLASGALLSDDQTIVI